jgi:hypothetical protein
LITTTGRLVVRRMVRVSSSSSIASVCSETWTVTVRPAWMRPSATGWRQTVITPVALTRRWTVTGSAAGAWWRAGGARALQPSRVFGGQRVGAHAQQLARVGVQEHQRVRFDADDHGAAAEDLGGEHLAAAEADQAAVVDGAVDLDRRAGFGRRQRRRTGRDGAVLDELGEVGDAQV